MILYLAGISGRNSAPSLVSVGGIVPHHCALVEGIVPHRWCQWGRNLVPHLTQMMGHYSFH
ncbi:unnamed protein product [Staurois parvus]|uniref:Uncharacterized protein n=1 Tax=Staurois parvus TaxID=386267 RepID=A0ABN9FCC7_9NEOB|nr:unnamed protein product [Staurois parvus]